MKGSYIFFKLDNDSIISLQLNRNRDFDDLFSAYGEFTSEYEYQYVGHYDITEKDLLALANGNVIKVRFQSKCRGSEPDEYRDVPSSPDANTTICFSEYLKTTLNALDSVLATPLEKEDPIKKALEGF